MKKVIFLTALILFAMCLSCTEEEAGSTKKKVLAGFDIAEDFDLSTTPADSSAIFFSGNTLSTLKPCGCSAGQLGGLSRRTAVLNTVQGDKKLVIDTGNLLLAETEQDTVKFGIILYALDMLDYDVVNFTEIDARVAAKYDTGEGFSFSQLNSTESASQDALTFVDKQIKVANREVKVKIASYGTENDDIDKIAEYFTADDIGSSIGIVIAENSKRRDIDKLAQKTGVDVIVCPSIPTEPAIISSKQVKPLLISAGLKGQYLGRLGIKISDTGELELDYKKVAVNEKLPKDEELLELYKDYQQLVRHEKLLENSIKVPLGGENGYLGDDKCAQCHEFEHDIWKDTKHAHAYKTLVGAGAEQDPECIACHVVGFGYESGFLTEKSDESLRNVGCEVCHGPGAEHVKSIKSEKGPKTFEPKNSCLQCHTPEHSGGFGGHEAEYMKKIRHW